jgi:hypothetical protein
MKILKLEKRVSKLEKLPDGKHDVYALARKIREKVHDPEVIRIVGQHLLAGEVGEAVNILRPYFDEDSIGPLTCSKSPPRISYQSFLFSILRPWCASIGACAFYLCFPRGGNTLRYVYVLGQIAKKWALM